MIDDLTKTIKAQLYDRISSPLISSFIISWAIWNYKFLIVIISSTPTKDKLLLLDTIFPSLSTILTNGFAYPLITALLIIFAYPYPAKFIYRFSKMRNQELKIIQTEIDDSTPMTREEAKKIRRDALINLEDVETRLEKSRLESSHLKERIVQLQKEIDSINSESNGEEEGSLKKNDGKKHEPRKESIPTDHYESSITSTNTAKPRDTPQDELDFKTKLLVSGLSEEAKKLLSEAAEDKSGTVLHSRYIGGTSILTNGKNQIPAEDARTIAEWENALQQLISDNFLSSVGNKNEIFKVTSTGYRVAEFLASSLEYKSEAQFAQEITNRLKHVINWDLITDSSSKIFDSLLEEYIRTHVPSNIAMKSRHRSTVTKNLQKALIQIKNDLKETR